MQSASKVNILLVDDYPENLIALEAILSSLGENLVKANSGEEALRCLLHQDFAVILLDVQMPQMDGFETATLIRQRKRSRTTPIIFLTAFSSNDTSVFKGYALGAVDYLLKPIDPTILTSKVTVFVDLFKKTMEVQRQAAELATINAQLSQSEQRFRSLSACSPIGIFLTDTTGQCTYTNPNTQAICGFKTEENWSSGWARIIHPEDSDRILTDWFCCIQQGTTYSDEFRIYTPTNAILWVHVRSSPMFCDRGLLLGHVGTIEDITQRKSSQSAQEQIIREQAARAEAEAANRMKDEFLAIISHELRTPLNSILGWVQLLLTKKFEPATTTKALETIQRNAKSQQQLIEDILDVSKIVQGKLRLLFGSVNLIELIETVVESLRPIAQTKAIQIETQLDPAAQKICGDPERLKQIIWNLLSNAIKFTPDKGRVVIRLERLEIKAGGAGEAGEAGGEKPFTTCPSQSAPQRQLSQVGKPAHDTGSPLSLTPHHSQITDYQLPVTSYAQITISDTGIGIKPDFLPYVFDRFRQADSSSTRSFGGLGLGLTIVRHLVDLHKGKIYADSAGEGKGATFTLRIPLWERTGKASNQEGREERISQPPTPKLDGVQVLVVEDNTDTRDFVKFVLEHSGAEVTAVESVSEAIAHLKLSNPDVLVSDIAMPEQDGYQFIRSVRELELSGGGNMPAIALSAHAKLEDRMLALKAGFQMHISKPVAPHELLSAVAQLVEPLKVEQQVSS